MNDIEKNIENQPVITLAPLFVQYCHHILNHFLGITQDHHGFVHLEKFIIEAIKNKDLERYKKNKKLNLLGQKEKYLKATASSPELGLKKEQSKIDKKNLSEC